MWYRTVSACTDHSNFSGDNKSVSDTSGMSLMNAKRTGEENESFPDDERDRTPFPIKDSMAALDRGDDVGGLCSTLANAFDVVDFDDFGALRCRGLSYAITFELKSGDAKVAKESRVNLPSVTQFT